MKSLSQPAVYLDVLARYRQAIFLWPDTAVQSDYAMFMVAGTHANIVSPARARAAQQQSLIHRPLEAAGWGRLAYLDHSSRRRDYLSASIELGRYMPVFMQWRFILALEYYPDMTAAEQGLVGEQAGLLWRKKRSNFIRLARVVPTASRVEEIMQKYYPDQFPIFLRSRGNVRHNSSGEDVK